MPRVLVVAVVLSVATGRVEADAVTKLDVGGYIETYYQLHFQNPDNRATNLRGFDARSRSFVLSNAALSLKGERERVSTQIVAQVGETGPAYYGAEAQPWQYLQTATVAIKAPGEVVVEAGLFPSPIGPEVFAVKDNANWSRSNLFVGLPFYHAGARATRPLGRGWAATLAVYNGWNNLVDTNGYPSVALSASFTCEQTAAQLLYFGGVERPPGAAEGRAWRHLVDAYASRALGVVTIGGHANAGVERNAIGTSTWIAAAGYAKLALSDSLYAATRGDVFRERSDGATPIFWPVAWVSSVTATLGYQPVSGVSVRLEYRHDHASSDAYFGGAVARDATSGSPIPDRRTQDTTTLGVTAWF